MADSKKSSGSKSASSKSTTRKTSTDQANANRVKKAVKKVDSSKSAAENAAAIGGIVKATATSAARSKSKQKRNLYTALCIILVVAIIAALVYGYFQGWFDSILHPEQNTNPGAGTGTGNGHEHGSGSAIVKGDLSIHFLELGNIYTGDCVYIKAGDVDILIDAGSKNTSTPTLIAYIDQYVTDGKLEYVIATHAHEDHIAGFYSESGREGIFPHYKTGTIIDFALTNADPTKTNTVYAKYCKARDAEVADGAVHYTAAQCFNETDGASRIYQITEDITLEILYSEYYFTTQSSGENDYSVCCILHQGDNHYLFTGDLESKGEKKLVNYYKEHNNPLPHCVLYKAGHHGSKTSTSNELMAAVTPEYCCVCCCCGTSEYTDTNANQFPTQEFVDRISPYTDKVYVTTMVDNYVEKNKWSKEGSVKSMNGNIVFSCTAGEITLTFSNNDTKLKDTQWFKDNRTMPDAWANGTSMYK